VVTDEQHKFGVEQRSRLKHAGKDIHHLAMSATPIPRSVALTLFGNVDIATLGELPHGKRDVVTMLFDRAGMDKVRAFIGSRLAEGERGYFVAPAIDESSGMASVDEEYRDLAARFGQYGVGLLHGRLPSAEKSRIIGEFRAGTLRLLVATTVIEVGVDVPEAQFIVIDQAEQYGLSQLHQLRGRVGRAGAQGYCLLVARTGESFAIERLGAFLGEDDGWRLPGTFSACASTASCR
jgi:ATP-dependent DNA helicase RecG